jgi:hypothetical protein
MKTCGKQAPALIDRGEHGNARHAYAVAHFVRRTQSRIELVVGESKHYAGNQ